VNVVTEYPVREPSEGKKQGRQWPWWRATLNRQSLLTQLTTATTIPLVALLIVLTVVAVFGFTRMTQALLEQRDYELVQLATQQIADYFADSLLLLTQVASTDAVRLGNIEASQALLDANVALQQRFDEIHLTGEQGTSIAAVGGEIGLQVGGLSFFDRTRQYRRPVRSALFSDVRGRQLMAASVPIYDARGRFAGCMVGIWNLAGSQLGLPVAKLRVGERGYAYLVDEFGTVLYHPDPGRLGADDSAHPAVARLLQGEMGAQTLSMAGRTVVVGYAPVPLRSRPSSLFADESWEGFGLLTAEQWSDINAPLRPYIILMAALMFLVVILPPIVLAVSSRRIVAPLQSLVTQVEKVAEGEFDTQVSINTGPSEVRELEVSFNRMVEQLRKYRRDIQSYVVSILNTQEAERKRIARELHDETAQTIIVLGRRIEMAQDLSDSAELTAELESIRDIVDDTLHSVRRFTTDLRPPLLEELGLPRTLELLGDRTGREETFTVDVNVIGEPRQLLPELELGIYRLAQESLSNVRRHARAKHANMTLVYGERALLLEVADDGIGFDAPDDPGGLVKSGRLGLIGIHERARLFGGRALITSRPQEGTVVRVEIPISAIVLPTKAAGPAQTAIPRGSA